MKKEIKIGDTVYIFDVNHRIYPLAAKGNLWSSGGPIWRKHFVPHTIKGQTSRSWLTSGGYKIPKNSIDSYCWSEDDIDKAEWVNDNRYKVARKVEMLKDYRLLKEIDSLTS